ncbi:MAG: sulfatase [Planctomycetes bacterium]|jgi:arylsulfatase A-like enzyme|nr:sulfatase [Planctomycetota bacterium]
MSVMCCTPRILPALRPVLLLLLLAGLRSGQAAQRPNIVLILADDLGWTDLGCYGADLHETPHIDRLAAEGVRFTQAYAMSVCSPSRAALMTGRHPARLHITIWAEGSLQGPTNRRLLQADSLHDLPYAEATLAKHLSDAGYLTALVGKWHLGDGNHYPETHGFDVNIGGTHWGAPQTYWWPYRGQGRFGQEFRYVPHLEFGAPGEYLTDRLTDEALRVIDRAAGKPFFLYLAHHAPHTPIEAKAEDVRHFTEKLRPDMKHRNPVYAAMVKSLDESVGRVLDHLKQRGLDGNTIVVFASDNGGYIGTDRKLGQAVPVTNNAPLRSGKGSLYEGGIRVPLLVRWPQVTPAGAACDVPITLMDLSVTLRGAGAPASLPAAGVDGLDLSLLLKDPASQLQREALYFHYPHYYETTTPVSAARAGDWKLLEYLEDNRLELFDLRNDPAERTDLAKESPEKAAELRTLLHTWRQAVGAALPKPNPDFASRAKSGRGKAG